jgi:hypothetical protein
MLNVAYNAHISHISVIAKSVGKEPGGEKKISCPILKFWGREIAGFGELYGRISPFMTMQFLPAASPMHIISALSPHRECFS